MNLTLLENLFIQPAPKPGNNSLPNKALNRHTQKPCNDPSDSDNYCKNHVVTYIWHPLLVIGYGRIDKYVVVICNNQRRDEIGRFWSNHQDEWDDLHQFFRPIHQMKQFSNGRFGICECCIIVDFTSQGGCLWAVSLFRICTGGSLFGRFFVFTHVEVNFYDFFLFVFGMMLIIESKPGAKHVCDLRWWWDHDVVLCVYGIALLPGTAFLFIEQRHKSAHVQYHTILYGPQNTPYTAGKGCHVHFWRETLVLVKYGSKIRIYLSTLRGRVLSYFLFVQ